MNRKEKILLGASCFFGGMVLGFLLAPIKKGVEIGNNSGNNYFPEKKENVEEDLEIEENTNTANE